METNNHRGLCLAYIITIIPISFIAFVLFSSYLSSNQAINRLREEMDEMHHIMMSIPNVQLKNDPKVLTDLVDAVVRKNLGRLFDDVYSLKKQVKAQQCVFSTSTPKNEGSFPLIKKKPVDARVNYASEELGARIESVNAEPIGGTNIIKSLLNLDYSSNPPINMLRPDMKSGNCFGFQYDKAEVTVKLAKPIIVTNFELEHIPSSLSPTSEVTSAPKDFHVYGFPNTSCICTQFNIQRYCMGSFQYKIKAKNTIQSFTPNKTLKCEYLTFKFTSNHGNRNYTCVYRLAVFGKLAAFDRSC